MKGQILEWNNGKGYQRGLFAADKQIKSLTHQKRGLVYLLDEDLNFKKNEKGQRILTVIELSKCKCIGFQD